MYSTLQQGRLVHEKVLLYSLRVTNVRARLIALSVSSLLLSILAPISIPQATATPALITCVNIETGAERISRTGNCRIGREAQANWHKNQTDSPIASGTSAKVIVICSNKESSPVSYQVIRKKCARHQVSTLFSRSGSLPAKPVIAEAVSYGHDNASLKLAADPASGLDAPVAYYTIAIRNVDTSTATKIETKIETKKIYSWRDLGLIVGGLQGRTTYTFTVTATTVDGTSAVSIASIPVTTPAYVPPASSSSSSGSSLAAPAFTLSSTSETKIVNNAISGYTISSTGGAIASYAISPAAPAGITFNTATGLLSGTPTSTQSATNYTITATNASGSATATFVLTIQSIGAPAFTISSIAETKTVNSSISGYSIASTGGTIVSFAISPATPAGVAFDTSTGLLSGTPTSIQSATTYTITATNAGGNSTATFSLTVTRLATKLSLSRASVGNTAGVAFTTQPQITIQDADNNTVTTSSQTVTATISTGGALVGTKTAVASSGVATFTNLGIRGRGSTAYTITYSVSGLTSATQLITTASAYSRGSTGPGGGVIFYLDSSGWTCGPTLEEKCYYLEVAPPALGLASWDTDTVNSVSRTWAQSSYQTTAVPDFGDLTTAWGVGYGYRNTLLIINQGNSDSSTSAAALAQSFAGGGFSDWFLPSRNELNELCQWQTARGCYNTPTTQNNVAGATGFVAGPYWSSSELSATEARSRMNQQGGDQGGGAKSSTALVRPIRAF